MNTHIKKSERLETEHARKPGLDCYLLALKKAACIKALRARFGREWYLSMACPCFGLQSVTFKAGMWTIRPLETGLFQGSAEPVSGRLVCFYAHPCFFLILSTFREEELYAKDVLHLEPGTDGEAVGKRRRAIHLHVMVSEEERVLIQGRMAEAEIRNMGAYIRNGAGWLCTPCGFIPRAGARFPAKAVRQQS